MVMDSTSETKDVSTGFGFSDFVRGVLFIPVCFYFLYIILLDFGITNEIHADSLFWKLIYPICGLATLVLLLISYKRRQHRKYVRSGACGGFSSTSTKLVALLAYVWLIPLYAVVLAFIGSVFVWLGVISWGGVIHIVMLGAPLWHFYSLRIGFTRADIRRKAVYDKLMTESPGLNYFENKGDCAFGLDVEKQEFTVITHRRARQLNLAVDRIPLSQVTDFGASTVDSGEVELVGDTSFRTAGAQLKVANRNARARAQQRSVTGLYLYLDDLVKPKVLLKTSYESAQRWELALKKLNAGTLSPACPPVDIGLLAN